MTTLMSDGILVGLNDAQREAVQSGAKCSIVLAGPGSGKTRSLTHRIAWLIQNGVDPSSILAVTFTNKAAGEMQERLAGMLGPVARRVVARASIDARNKYNSEQPDGWDEFHARMDVAKKCLALESALDTLDELEADDVANDL